MVVVTGSSSSMVVPGSRSAVVVGPSAWVVVVVPPDAFKSRRPHVVILNDIAWSIVQSQRGKHPIWVFPYRGKPIGTMNNTAWQSVRRAVGLTPVRIHDLRHTFGSRLRAAGVSEEDRAALLGHQEKESCARGSWDPDGQYDDIIPLAVQWWSTWYPGSEPGGGSYIAQRILACIVNIGCDIAQQRIATPDDIDWDDEVRIAIEERAAFSPDALTGMEASLRFPGPETMETKIFARLSAWQNWIFQRPNAVGAKGALTAYGSQSRPGFDFNRT